jgi:adenylylsulfate kinase
LFLDAGLVVIAAFISPYNKTREDIKAIVGSDYYIEVFVNTPLEVCEQRDVKGLYKKARAGTIKNFTGISAPFEIPTKPTIEVETLKEPPEEAVVKILAILESKL